MLPLSALGSCVSMGSTRSGSCVKGVKPRLYSTNIPMTGVLQVHTSTSTTSTTTTTTNNNNTNNNDHDNDINSHNNDNIDSSNTDTC